jgi:hypothetical protein
LWYVAHLLKRSLTFARLSLPALTLNDTRIWRPPGSAWVLFCRIEDIEAYAKSSFAELFAAGNHA